MRTILRVLLRLLLLGMGLCTLLRVVLFTVNAPSWSGASIADIARPFLVHGPIFDLYVNAVLLALPAAVLGLRWSTGSIARWPVHVACWSYTALFIVLAAFGCMDVPFFGQFNFHITRAALTWMDTPWQSIKEVFTTPGYFAAFVGIVMLAWLGVKWVGRLFEPLLKIEGSATVVEQRPVASAAYAFPLAALVLVGANALRGPAAAPLAATNAYFCERPFLNMLGLNAGFTLLDSFDDDEVRYMTDSVAVTNARALLGIRTKDPIRPFARPVAYDSAERRMNVVLIIVESLSADRMAHFGNTHALTPFLDSLADRSLFFDHFFSTGVHTHNGVFSSLYGWPVVGDRPSMAHVAVRQRRFHALPQVLKQHGYRTLFLYVGEKMFDNMGGFLPNNGFDAVLGSDDYDPAWSRTSWGVPDHALYAEGIERMDSRARTGDPFFTTFLTISSHAGYVVPTDIPFDPPSDRSDENIYQYMDWALSGFFATARTKTWFANTLFVITGDHGQAFDRTYEMPLSYHRIPLLVYSPGSIQPRIDHRLGSQLDVSETVLGMLRLPHENNTLGIDLAREQRPFAVFSADAKLAAVNERFYWMCIGDRQQLYHWPSNSPSDVLAAHTLLADSMRHCAESTTQAARWAMESGAVGPQ